MNSIFSSLGREIKILALANFYPTNGLSFAKGFKSLAHPTSSKQFWVRTQLIKGNFRIRLWPKKKAFQKTFSCCCMCVCVRVCVWIWKKYFYFGISSNCPTKVDDQKRTRTIEDHHLGRHCLETIKNKLELWPMNKRTWKRLSITKPTAPWPIVPTSKVKSFFYLFIYFIFFLLQLVQGH